MSTKSNKSNKSTTNRKSTHKARHRDNNDWSSKTFIRNTRNRTALSKKSSKIMIELSDIIGNSSREGDTVYVAKELDRWIHYYSVNPFPVQSNPRGFALSLLPEKNKLSLKRQDKYSKFFSHD